MYVCTVITHSRVWTNRRVRLPVLLVVSLTGKRNIPLSPFAPENLVSRRVSLLNLHSQAESSAYSRDSSSQFPRRRPFIHSTLHTPSGQSRVYRVPESAYRWRSQPRVLRHRASSPQGSSSNGYVCREEEKTTKSYVMPLSGRELQHKPL